MRMVPVMLGVRLMMAVRRVVVKVRMISAARGIICSQVFFGIRAESCDAVLRAKEIVAAIVRDVAGGTGGIDFHPAHRIPAHNRRGRGFTV